MRFDRGTHIRVRRPVWLLLRYYHHGIYVNDARVIQFGGGIGDKRHATLGPVTLAEFERGERAEVVQHGGKTWWGVPRFPAVSPEVAVRRAERLVEMQPHGLYDLFGSNCEQAATFCSTDSYESYQVRGFFAVRWFVSWPLLLYVAFRARKDRPPSTGLRLLLYAWSATGLVAHLLYYWRGERFMRKAGRSLIEWERRQGNA